MSQERMASLIFFFLGIYVFIFSIQLPMGRWNEPGPGGYPLCLSILLCISGILWFIHGKTKGEKKKRTVGQIIQKFWTPIQIVVVTVVFILCLTRLGYLLTSSLYMFLLFFWVSRYKLWSATGLALFLGVGSWYFFGKILAIQLPKGFWMF